MTGLYRQIIFGAATAQVVAFATYLVLAAYVIPFWDTLDWIDGYYASDSLLQWLWQQHADVRQPVVKYLLWLDLRWFDGTFYPIAAIGFFGLFLCLIGIAGVARAHTTSPTGRAFALGLPFILGFQSFTLPAYMETSLVQHVLVVVFVIGAVWPLVRYSERVPSAWQYGAAAVGALLASLTFPNGLLAWPLVAWLAWRRRAAITWPVLYLVAGLVVALAYFSEYRWSVGISTAANGDQILAIFGFVVEFFSVPWIRVPVLYPLGIGIGIVMLAIGGHLAARSAFGRLPHNPLSELATAMLVFTIGSALMVAAARADFLDLRTQGTRYGIYAALAHLAVALYALPEIDRFSAFPATRRRALAAIALVLALGLAVQQIVIGEKAASAGRAMVDIRVALRAGTATPQDMMVIYPDPVRGDAHVALLKREGLYGLSAAP